MSNSVIPKPDLTVEPGPLGELGRTRGGPTDPSRDDQLRKGILHTEISRKVALALAAVFLAFIYVVPISQLVLEKVKQEESVLADLFQRVPTKESLAQLEDDLEQTSYVKEFVQPRVQLLLTRIGREGNEKAIVGDSGFLYYKPGITFLGGPGFLDPEIHRAREKSARDAGEPELHADPRPAIFAFNAALAERGILLLIFPVPDKAMLQPAELHGRESAGNSMLVPRSRDWWRFIGELKQRGVLVFDPTPARITSGQKSRFLIQDSHWTPEWMQSVARELAVFVSHRVRLSAPPPVPPFLREPAEAERLGDIVDMLKLPENQTLFEAQRVQIFNVVNREGEAFEPDPKAEVLLLGDSFTNVFSEEFMGWGTAAGLAPQLAVELGRPIDVIAQNDSGAFATRVALARELEQEPTRLDGKKVVIWEFASRELAVGNWKPVDWSKPENGKKAR